MADSSLSSTVRTIYERTTVEIQFTLKDLVGVVIPAADLQAFTVTVYDTATGTIINTRNAQSILNTNNGTVSAGGVVVFAMQPADNAIVSTDADCVAEEHGVQFRWTWGSVEPYKVGELLTLLRVVNRAKVS